jgi:hypothetical protein
VVTDQHAPAFASGKFWVTLVEKAWAKAHGTYSRINKGLAHETLRDLTGAPSYEYIIKTEESMFDIIIDADR